MKEYYFIKGIDGVVQVPVDPEFIGEREAIFITSEDVYQAASMDNIGSLAMLFGMRYVSIQLELNLFCDNKILEEFEYIRYSSIVK